MLEQIVPARIFFLLFVVSFYFLDLNDVDELKLNAEINFFQITTWNVWNFRQILEFDCSSFQLQSFY